MTHNSKRHIHRGLLLGFIILAAGIALIASTAQTFASPSAPSTADGQARVADTSPRSVASDEVTGCAVWSVAPSPNVGSGDNILRGVTAVNANDIWAAGSSDGDLQTLVEHWDGIQWTIIPSPNPGAFLNKLVGIDALTADDIWTVGSSSDAAGSATNTLIQHWDGSHWSIVPSPNPGPNTSDLWSVAAISTNDVWAVGYSNAPYRVLTEHWDGVAWSVVPAPSPGSSLNVLVSVAAINANSVWAVGSAGGVYQTLVEHWDGSSWSIIPSPSPGSGGNGFFAVAAGSANDVWAGGWYFNTGNSVHTLTEHWDGNQWSLVSSPGAGSGDNTLRGLAISSSNDAWAVGASDDYTTAPQKLALHWDGAQWSIADDPNVHPLGDYFFGVTTVAQGDVWAVGWYKSGNVQRTLIERYGCPQLTPTATSTSTSTPTSTPTLTYTPTSTHTQTPAPAQTGTPTNTPTATTTIATASMTSSPTATATPSRTATVTPTLCAMAFTDVHASDYFYEAVRYLYCGGIISGYGDGTFRPYNNTTRGQLTKIIVLAEGWSIYTLPSPTFNDVPSSSAFYPFVETAYNHGVISGYGDGSFRPYNDVTRGQLCKIVVIARGWQLSNPSTPTFSDVPFGSGFYEYVETAYSRGIISGYSDRTFRPGNNATRGQISKIVYQAITN